MSGNFFFFQAEDGIRDVAVTGVQTCALPISGYTGRRAIYEIYLLNGEMREIIYKYGGDVGRLREAAANSGMWDRSEERRVGKEGRSRGAPDHLKKKKKLEKRQNNIYIA